VGVCAWQRCDAAGGDQLATTQRPRIPLEDSPKEGAPAEQGFKGHKVLDKKGDARAELTNGGHRSGTQPMM
jgi:hypothetical protein